MTELPNYYMYFSTDTHKRSSIICVVKDEDGKSKSYRHIRTYGPQSIREILRWTEADDAKCIDDLCRHIRTTAHFVKDPAQIINSEQWYPEDEDQFGRALDEEWDEMHSTFLESQETHSDGYVDDELPSYAI